MSCLEVFFQSMMLFYFMFVSVEYLRNTDEDSGGDQRPLMPLHLGNMMAFTHPKLSLMLT